MSRWKSKLPQNSTKNFYFHLKVVFSAQFMKYVSLERLESWYDKTLIPLQVVRVKNPSFWVTKFMEKAFFIIFKRISKKSKKLNQKLLNICVSFQKFTRKSELIYWLRFHSNLVAWCRVGLRTRIEFFAPREYKILLFGNSIYGQKKLNNF